MHASKDYAYLCSDDPANTAAAAITSADASLFANIKQQSFEQMALGTGARVLDVGCGAGTDTVALGRLIGPHGEVHGVDYDVAMVSVADACARFNAVDAWVSHHHANAAALPWPSGYFDACRSECVFQHLHEPERAYDEILRVTKAGGQLVLIDTDWATLTIDTDETELERRLVQFHAAHMMNNPYSGRHLNRMFHRRGLQNIRLKVQPVCMTDLALARQILRLDHIAEEALAAGAIDAEQASRWQQSLARLSTAGGFFASLNIVMVSGQKPAHGRHARPGQPLGSPSPT